MKWMWTSILLLKDESGEDWHSYKLNPDSVQSHDENERFANEGIENEEVIVNKLYSA